jgi:hypothetical protein
MNENLHRSARILRAGAAVENEGHGASNPQTLPIYERSSGEIPAAGVGHSGVHDLRGVAASQPLPYCGDREFEHLAKDGPHTTRTYATDQSGTKTYRFNALGFRGEDFDPTAALRIFVCGASYAFGTGLNWEETWGYQLKLKVAAERGLDPGQVNLLNFSQSLASANYVTRTLMSQCSRIRPDLVVALYSIKDRAEYFLDGAPVGLLPVRFPWYRRWWVLRPGWRRRLSRWFPGAKNKAVAGDRLRAWNHFSRLASAETAIINTLTNMLLLQSFSRARDIDCLVSWVQHQNLSDMQFLKNAAISPLIRLIDKERFCPFSLVDPGISVDDAADNVHPGVRSNAIFADRLFETYRRELAHAS